MEITPRAKMNEVKVKSIYRHYKGDLYLVEDIATHSETGEKMVIYRGLYEDSPLYARPMSLFLDELNPEKAEKSGQKYRFELQEIKSLRNDWK